MMQTKPVDEALLDLDYQASSLADVLFNSDAAPAKKSRALAVRFIERSLRDLVTRHMDNMSKLPRRYRRRVAAIVTDRSRDAFLRRWSELEGGAPRHG